MLRARPPLPPLASLLRSYRRRVHWRGIVRCLSRDIGQPSHFTHPNLLREEEILPGMHKSEFAGRRTALLSELAKTHTGMTNDRHLVIIPAAPIKYMTADIPYRFHQNPDLLYLTGFQEPDSVLLLESSADHGPLPHHKAVLYVRPRNLLKELWDGPRAGTDDAVEFTGVDEAYTIDNLEQHLEKRYSQEGYTVWYYTESAIHPEHNKKIVASLTKSPGSRITSVHTPSHALNALRLVKSQSEIALMRKAGEIAATAFRETMCATSPGMNEQQLEAVFECSVKSHGAQWLSFPPVVAGGRRATCLHYIANNRELSPGELVLMDAGCEYYGYASDVTRTWPISHHFTAAQQDIYNVILGVKRECTEACRPGVTLNYLDSLAVQIFVDELKRMGVISDRLSSTDLVQLMGKILPHHIGHYLGMDTHDTMAVDRNTILAPGMAITIEPGLYITEEYARYSGPSSLLKELAGTGIRLEDDVLLTESGCEVLNRDCPETIDNITAIIDMSITHSEIAETTHDINSGEVDEGAQDNEMVWAECAACMDPFPQTTGSSSHASLIECSDAVSSHDDLHTCPQPGVESVKVLNWSGFKVIGDNIDKTVRSGHQTLDSQTRSLHYFHAYAVKVRIDCSSLSDVVPDIDLTT